jgi:hypothetical protein
MSESVHAPWSADRRRAHSPDLSRLQANGQSPHPSSRAVANARRRPIDRSRMEALWSPGVANRRQIWANRPAAEAAEMSQIRWRGDTPPVRRQIDRTLSEIESERPRVRHGRFARLREVRQHPRRPRRSKSAPVDVKTSTRRRRERRDRRRSTCRCGSHHRGACRARDGAH